MTKLRYKGNHQSREVIDVRQESKVQDLLATGAWEYADKSDESVKKKKEIKKRLASASDFINTREE